MTWALDQVLVHPNPMPSCDYLSGTQVNGCHRHFGNAVLTVWGAVQAPIVYADGSTSQQVLDASYNRLTGSLPPFLASSNVQSFIKNEIFLQVGCSATLRCLCCVGLSESCTDAGSAVQRVFSAHCCANMLWT